MASYPEVGDLRLVVAIARHGSLGAAARELLVSQPSASQRLAALERRCGVRLFDRDNTGARPTAAGQEMVAEAGHILGHLERVFERSRAAAESETITVGTIPSLAMLVFPALHVALPHLRTSQVVDHGPRLVDWVAEGSLDAAFVAIAGQIELPKGVTGQVVGVDRIGVLVPATCDLHSTDRRQFAGRTVVTYTTDYSGEELDGRVVALGATPYRAATAETAVRLGRFLGHPVVMPRSLLRSYLSDSDRELVTPPVRRPATVLGDPGPDRAVLEGRTARRRQGDRTVGGLCSHLIGAGRRGGDPQPWAGLTSFSLKLERIAVWFRHGEGPVSQSTLIGRHTSMSTPTFRPKYVSFDCYGTLISWPMTPITKELVGDQIPADQWDRFVAEFRGYRYDQVCGEYYPYEQVLQDSFERVCRKWGIEADPNAGKRFADGVRSWGPHPDVPAPLKKMGEHYKLVILSNAEDSFLAESVPRLGADFHAVFTAEQAGFYKPRYAAFEYMLDQLDATPEDFVHVSSHTRYDPLPMHDMGFRNLVLLDRGYDPVPPGYGLVTVKSLDELNTMLGI